MTKRIPVIDFKELICHKSVFMYKDLLTTKIRMLQYRVMFTVSTLQQKSRL